MIPDTSPTPDSDPQIQQNVEGDRNQVIEQAIDSTILNFAGDGQVITLSIHDRIPAASLPPSNIVVQTLTQQEYRQRQVLLNKVKDAWVKGVLEKSLHARVLIELGLQERPDLVQQPFSDVAEFADVPGQALPEGTPATTVFDRMGLGRTLLIVGEPGSGKTIALLKLAEDLIVRTESDSQQPIPVVLNLSSWTRKKQTIEQWLIQELLEKYQVSKALGKAWVETEALILLLDGLDEVKVAQRNVCVQAVNQFIQNHGTTEIVICCRIQDYAILTDRLMVRNAICIQSLTSEKIRLYLEQAGEQLSALRVVLQQDLELQKLATSPLMLSVMSFAYQNFIQEQIAFGGKPEDYRKRLFDTYLDRMFERQGKKQQYSREETQRWLTWLAQQMTVAAQTIFLIERLQPSWLPSKGQQIRYYLESGFIAALVYGLFGGVIDGSDRGLSVGLNVGLIGGLSVLFQRDIKPIETLKWSWLEVRHGFQVGLIYGLVYGLIYGLSAGLIEGLKSGLGYGVFVGLFYSLVVSLVGGLYFGIIIGFRGPEIEQKGKSNQGIWSSAQNSVIFGIILSAILGSIYSLTNGLSDGLIYGLNDGLIGGMIGGGNACMRHFLLRLILYRKGYIAWNYARFLNNATERLFLQKVGGGYIFVHRMLLEHFAGLTHEHERR